MSRRLHTAEAGPAYREDLLPQPGGFEGLPYCLGVGLVVGPPRRAYGL
jgi:hypothetical protein